MRLHKESCVDDLAQATVISPRVKRNKVVDEMGRIKYQIGQLVGKLVLLVEL